MSDEELDRVLRESRPPTAADAGWAESAAGDRVLAAVRSRTTTGRGFALPALRRPRLVGLAVGLAAASAAAIAVGLAAGPPADHGPGVALPTGPNGRPGGPGPVPARMALAAYTSCDAMLDQLRAHTADHVGPYGLPGSDYLYAYFDRLGGPARTPAALTDAGKSVDSAPDHSTTNTQEVGVGEPDIVVTDGNRLVSVSGGVLRVVDAATHEVTGQLGLGLYAGAQSAQLLMSGDRVLVLLNDYSSPYYSDVIDRGPYAGPGGDAAGTTALLVDLADGTPSVLGTLHTDGQYVQARMVGETVRLVVQSTPEFRFPAIRGRQTATERTAANRAAVQRAPLTAWLPTYEATAGGRTTSGSVPCTSVSHPARYTGESMLTVYTVNLDGDLADPQPISLAANGANVYASDTSLYVADTRYTRHNDERTQLHRFDIEGAGKPTYLGSHAVPGSLLNSYSMSEYDGTLRVVTTQGEWRSRAETSVYVLDADTLTLDGSVGGIGRGEQVHAVRFLGALAYVVTFKSVDPMFVVDLADPEHPRIAGELTMPGYSDYLHPIGDGRLLGVGQDVSGGLVSGLQISLFDVSSPDDPQRLDNVTREHTPSESPIDPHAFLYWATDRIAVVPIDSWNYRQSGAALVVRVDNEKLTVLGTIRNPVGSSNGYATGIERTLVIGDQLWTMSSSGLRVSDLHSLDREAWVPFS
ncbi:MAG: hypothetical protein QOI15_2277 [Pseudonocardiales bacterium]|jgi:hypothetical protein|nr:hypothetical protein [Pseudonocardiales bacterium]MDT4921375.1 hypothetical protein [Pseudonocardiales bacterium]